MHFQSLPRGRTVSKPWPRLRITIVAVDEYVASGPLLEHFPLGMYIKSFPKSKARPNEREHAAAATRRSFSTQGPGTNVVLKARQMTRVA